MTAMFAAAVKENKQSALQFFNQMFQNGHSNGQQGSTSLLPNLFNAERAIQQQRNTSRAPSEPVKAMASRPVSRSSVGSSAQKHDEESNTATASKKAGPAMVAIPRLKHWPAGCLKCGRTESTQWRVRKKRMRPLDGSDIAITEDGEEEVKKLCEGGFDLHLLGQQSLRANSGPSLQNARRTCRRCAKDELQRKKLPPLHLLTPHRRALPPAALLQRGKSAHLACRC